MGMIGSCLDGKDANPRAAKQKAELPVPLPSQVTALELVFGK